MYWLFMICAAVGGTVFVCQFVMAIVGIGADDVDFGHDIPHDMPHDIPPDMPHDFSGDAGHAVEHGHAHGSTWLFGVISFRTVIAAMTFFGLAGLAAHSGSLSPQIALLIAIGAGAIALYGVHFLMQTLYRLRADGTVRIHRTIGERGTVYVPIPPNHEGLGKIQIRTQGRIMEYAARTRGPNRLKTGSTVEVVEVLSPMTVEVEPVDAVAEPAERQRGDQDVVGPGMV